MTKPPPTPPDNRSPKGTGDDKPAETGTHKAGPTNPNTREQGRQGNIKQNTTNQGYQQDR
jgi:hypothetical protein